MQLAQFYRIWHNRHPDVKSNAIWPPPREQRQSHHSAFSTWITWTPLSGSPTAIPGNPLGISLTQQGLCLWLVAAWGRDLMFPPRTLAPVPSRRTPRQYITANFSTKETLMISPGSVQPPPWESAPDTWGHTHLTGHKIKATTSLPQLGDFSWRSHLLTLPWLC